MRGNRRRDPRRRPLRPDEKPGVDPGVLWLGVAMMLLYGAILWLWLTPDATVANVVGRWLP
jgi:hypothetical protein